MILIGALLVCIASTFFTAFFLWDWSLLEIAGALMLMGMAWEGLDGNSPRWATIILLLIIPVSMILSHYFEGFIYWEMIFMGCVSLLAVIFLLYTLVSENGYSSAGLILAVMVFVLALVTVGLLYYGAKGLGYLGQ